MRQTAANQELAKLRGWRVHPQRDLSIAAVVEDERKRLTRHQKAVGGAGLAWDAVVPARLATRTQVLRLSRGTLTVRVQDAAARFELDRFLRSGGEAELVRRAGGALRRVKLSL